MVKTTGDAHANQSTVSETLALCRGSSSRYSLILLDREFPHFLFRTQPNVSPNLMFLSSFGETFAICFAKSNNFS